MNYTAKLLSAPLALLASFAVSTNYVNLQRCLSCSQATSAYSAELQICCIPAINLPSSNQAKVANIISGCTQCSACQVISATSACAACSVCQDLPSATLNSQMAILSASFQDILFEKKIYYILMTEGSSLSVSPPLNDSATFENLYKNVLVSQSSCDLAAKELYQCSACPINAVSCYKPQGFEFSQKLMDAFNFNGVDLSQQISYYLQAKSCKQGFIYDVSLRRCRFCPNNWTACAAFKRIYITFDQSLSENDPFTVTSLEEMLTLLSFLESQQLSFILNEFAVETLELFLQFPTSFDFSLSFSKQIVQISADFKLRIPTLSNFSLILQPVGYESQENANINNIKAKVYWLTQLQISNFDNIFLRNLEIIVTPQCTLGAESGNFPGFIAVSAGFSLQNCAVIAINSNNYCLDGASLLANDYFSNNSVAIFAVSADTVAFSQVFVNISMDLSTNSLQVSDNYLFSIECEIFAIDAFFFENANFLKAGVFSLDIAGSIIAKNLNILNVFMQNAYFLYNTAQIADQIFEVFSINSSVFRSPAFAFLYSPMGSCEIREFSLKNCVISGDFAVSSQISYFFVLAFLKISGFSLENNEFYFSNILQISPSSPNTAELVLLDGYFSRNSFNLSNSTISAVFFSVDTINFLYLDNMTFLWNIVLYDTSQNSAYFARMSAISANITIKNLQSVDNFNISAFLFEDTQEVFLQNLHFSQSFCSASSQQDGFFFDSVTNYIQIVDCSFENYTTSSGLINIQNVKADAKVGALYISAFSQNFVQFSEVSSNTGAGILLFSKKTWIIAINSSFFWNSLLLDKSDYAGSACGVSFDSIYSEITIENCSFSNLTSSGEHVAAFFNVKSIKILHTFFEFANFYQQNNLSQAQLTRISSLGSFLSLRVSAAFLENCVFRAAFALSGGAIYLQPVNRDSVLQVISCNFSNIHAVSSGGVVAFLKTSGEKASVLSFSQCFFELFLAMKAGGALYSPALQNNQIFFENCVFHRFDAEDGSVVYSEFSNVSLKNCEISENFQWFSDISVYNFLMFNDLLVFNSTTFAGSLFSNKYCVLFFENLTVSAIEAALQSPAIANVEEGQLTAENSVFSNISFFFSGFYLSNSDFIAKNASFANSSNLRFQTLNFQGFSFIYLLSNSLLKLNDSFIENFTCFYCFSGVFLYSSQAVVELFNDKFIANNGTNHGILYIYLKEIKIFNCIFLNNGVETSAGVLYLDSSDSLINNTNFTNNSAYQGYGGAIYYKTSNNSVNLRVYNTIFLNNSASIGGAIYYQNVKIFIDSSTSFLNNSATAYGQSIYSYPAALRIQKNNDTSQYFFENSFILNSFVSGSVLPNLTVELLDEENNTYTSTKYMETTTLSLQLAAAAFSQFDPLSIYSLNQTSFTITENGTFEISHVLLILKPTDSVQIVMKSPQIYIAEASNFTQNYNYTFTINSRACILGEIFQTMTGICCPCTSGTYSFNINDANCIACPEGLLCESYLPGVKPGYWRHSNYSLFILSCFNNPEACQGGASSGNEICSQGYIGARCEACDLMGKYWGSYYARGANKSCTNCEDMTLNYIILVVLAIVNFLSMSFSIIGTLKNIKQMLQVKVIGALSRYSMLRMLYDESSIYIKIYLAYFQILQVLSTMELAYPTWINSFSSVVGNPTESSLYSTDCLIRYFGNMIPYIYIKLVIALLVPFIYLIIFSLGYLLFISRVKIHRKYSMLYTASLFTLIYFQPAIIQNTISVLSCINIGDKSYIKADVSYLCDSSDYWLYSFVIGIPSLIIWALVVPGTILWRLIKNKRDLNEIRIKVRYGYIYQEYRLFYWEFVKMYEKIFVTLFLQFYENEILIKGLLILAIVVLYLLLVSKYKPYKTSVLTKVDQISTSVLCLSIFLALFSYQNQFQYLVDISFYLLILINAVYNVFMLLKILKSFFAEYMLNENFVKLTRKFPLKYFFKYNKNTHNNGKSKWKLVRRAVAKYLRERERRRLDDDYLINEKNMHLSLEDYDPGETGVKRELRKKKNSKISSELMMMNFTEENSPVTINRVYESNRKHFEHKKERDCENCENNSKNCLKNSLKNDLNSDTNKKKIVTVQMTGESIKRLAKEEEIELCKK